jgi:hypothetical protein
MCRLLRSILTTFNLLFPPSLDTGRFGGSQMNRRGVEFTVMEAEPGLWKWQFQIGETVTTGKTKSNLRGMAAHRVQQRIDRELRKPRDLMELHTFDCLSHEA